jgi:hypothetical protein
VQSNSIKDALTQQNFNNYTDQLLGFEEILKSCHYFSPLLMISVVNVLANRIRTQIDCMPPSKAVAQRLGSEFDCMGEIHQAETAREWALNSIMSAYQEKKTS